MGKVNNILLDEGNVYISNYIFPLFSFLNHNDTKKIDKFLGTGFFIGKRGFAITCEHVIKKFQISEIIAVYTRENKKNSINLIEYEVNEEHDIVIMKFENVNFKSPLSISPKLDDENEYILYGYPELTALEDISNRNIDGSLKPNPDLIFSKGYIRRNCNKKLEHIRNNFIEELKGNQFYELNELAGWGCSGSPIIDPKYMNIMRVIGVYVAQYIHYDDNKREEKFYDYSVGYAVKSECFYTWRPEILGGKTIQQESNTD